MNIFLKLRSIGSFVFRSKKPFHPDRFLDYVQNKFPSNIIRSKGLFWLGSRPKMAIIWSSAGGSLKTDPAGVWWASMPYGERISYPGFVHNQEQIEKEWDPTYGDRKIELVFIGQHLEVEKTTKDLEACLLTDSELATLYAEAFPTEDNWPLPDF